MRDEEDTEGSGVAIQVALGVVLLSALALGIRGLQGTGASAQRTAAGIEQALETEAGERAEFGGAAADDAGAEAARAPVAGVPEALPELAAVARTPGQKAVGGSTTYGWRLVDSFGAPLANVMVTGRWLDAEAEAIRATQTLVDDSGEGSKTEVTWTEDAPVEVRLDSGAPGSRALTMSLPAPVVGGRTELGDLEVPTVADDYDEPLVTGRVLDADGTTTEGLLALGWIGQGLGSGDRATWRKSGGGVVLVDPRSGDFEMFGPEGLATSLMMSFQAPNRISVKHEGIAPGTRDLVVTMQPAQLVRVRFDLPESEETWEMDCEFWSDRWLSRSYGYPGQQDLMRPVNADELRIVCPLSGFVLHRFRLPPSDGQMLELEPADLRESVGFFEIPLLDAGGEARIGATVLLERPDGERILVDTGTALEFFAPRNAGVLRVGLAEDGELLGAFLSLDLAAPAASLSFP